MQTVSYQQTKEAYERDTRESGYPAVDLFVTYCGLSPQIRRSWLQTELFRIAFLGDLFRVTGSYEDPGDALLMGYSHQALRKRRAWLESQVRPVAAAAALVVQLSSRRDPPREAPAVVDDKKAFAPLEAEKAVAASTDPSYDLKEGIRQRLLEELTDVTDPVVRHNLLVDRLNVLHRERQTHRRSAWCRTNNSLVHAFLGAYYPTQSAESHKRFEGHFRTASQTVGLFTPTTDELHILWDAFQRNGSTSAQPARDFVLQCMHMFRLRPPLTQ